MVSPRWYVSSRLEGIRSPRTDQLVDRQGASRAGEDDHGVLVTTDRIVDDPARVREQPGGLQAGAAGLCVGVGVTGGALPGG